MSAVSERARDFWDRISPRERGLVLIAAVVAPLTLVIWLGLAIGDGLAGMQARNDKMRKALTVLADLKARGPRQPVDDVVSGMPVEPLSLETYLSNAATTAGLGDRLQEERLLARLKLAEIVFEAFQGRLRFGVIAMGPEANLGEAEVGRPGLVLTDVGSTKAAIAQEMEERLPSQIFFVGGHPLAGSEKGG